MEYAYSLIETKDFDDSDDVFYISGIASTPAPDRSNDIVEPMGAKFQTPMPLLWMHDNTKPVGRVTFAEPNEKGIPFRAEIPKVSESGTLKQRVDEAIHSLKYKLVAAVSIGFRAKDYEHLKNGGIKFNVWEWLELSLVTIPAQPDAKIEMIKSLDRQTLAALGNEKHDQKPALRERKAIKIIPRKKSNVKCSRSY